MIALLYQTTNRGCDTIPVSSFSVVPPIEAPIKSYTEREHRGLSAINKKAS